MEEVKPVTFQSNLRVTDICGCRFEDKIFTTSKPEEIDRLRNKVSDGITLVEIELKPDKCDDKGLDSVCNSISNCADKDALDAYLSHLTDDIPESYFNEKQKNTIKSIVEITTEAIKEEAEEKEKVLAAEKVIEEEKRVEIQGIIDTVNDFKKTIDLKKYTEALIMESPWTLKNAEIGAAIRTKTASLKESKK